MLLYYCFIEDFRSLFENASDSRLPSLCGRMLAKKLIADLTGMEEQEISFSVAPGGKPFVQNCAVQFSISHSGKLAVCAADFSPVGADVQKLQPLSPAMAKRLFSPAEQQAVFGAETPSAEAVKNLPHEQLMRWFSLWCGKEALAKLDGSGLSRRLLNDDLAAMLEKRRLILTQVPLAEGYVCAVLGSSGPEKATRIL